MRVRAGLIVLGAFLVVGCGSGRSLSGADAATRTTAEGSLATPTPVATGEARKITPPKPAIVSAQEWGSNPDPIPDERRQEVKQLTVHHAGELWKPTDDPLRKLTGLQAWGKRDKGWHDLPYHFLIAPDGRIFEGRNPAYEPESNTKYDKNGHIGIQLWGNFEEQRMSRQQLESLVSLLAWLSAEYDVDPATIAGHRDRAPGQTSCPGKDLERYIHGGQLQAWVAEARAGKMPNVTPLPALEGGPTETIPGGTQ